MLKEKPNIIISKNIVDTIKYKQNENIENNKTYTGFDKYIFLFNCFNIKWIPIIKL